VTRPRAADDFPTIRARMEELRRERARVPADDDPRRASAAPPYADTRPALASKSGLLPAIRRAIWR
jgi:hypothetical protein